MKTGMAPLAPRILGPPEFARWIPGGRLVL